MFDFEEKVRIVKKIWSKFLKQTLNQQQLQSTEQKIALRLSTDF